MNQKALLSPSTFLTKTVFLVFLVSPFTWNGVDKISKLNYLKERNNPNINNMGTGVRGRKKIV